MTNVTFVISTLRRTSCRTSMTAFERSARLNEPATAILAPAVWWWPSYDIDFYEGLGLILESARRKFNKMWPLNWLDLKAVL